MNTDAKACKNCEEELPENVNYCPNCGQKADTGRINWHFLWHEIQHGIFHVDGGILYTLKELFVRPGHTLREYIAGKRKNHFKPVLLVMIIGSICGLINYFLKTKDKLVEVNNSESISGNSADLKRINQYLDMNGFVEFMQKVFNWFPEHLAFTILLLVPILAYSFYLAFKKSKVNYVEWLVITCFISGQALLIYAVSLLLAKISGIFTTICLFLMIGLVYRTLLQYFNKDRNWSIVLRTTFAWFLYFVLGALSLLILVIGITSIGLMIYGNEGIIKEFLSN